MKEELLNNIKDISKDAHLEPPSRVWNRLEYKLDRFEFEKKENRKNKLIYISSVAAVFVVIISLITYLKSDNKQIGVYANSRILIEEYQKNDITQQVYDIKVLNKYYSNLKQDKYTSKLKALKVNFQRKGI